MGLTPESLADWTPIRVYWDGGEPWVDWCRVDESRFVEPFYEQTLERLVSRTFNLLFRHRTPLKELPDLLGESVEPRGFIFHMSRCGSTLIAQMLAASPRHVVISEADPIDNILRQPHRQRTVTAAERIEWLQWMVGALLRRRRPEEESGFIKFDCWHTVFLPLIRRAFPNVPWLFVYRDPLEVIVSHNRQPGVQMIPGVLDPSLFGIDLQHPLTSDEYCARVLACLCEAAAVRHLHDPALLVNYTQLPELLTTKIAAHFGIKYAQSDIQLLQEVSRRDVKNRGALFTQDTESKRREATEEQEAMADVWVRPWYDKLEALRQNAMDGAP